MRENVAERALRFIETLEKIRTDLSDSISEETLATIDEMMEYFEGYIHL